MEITDSWEEIFAAIDDGTYKAKYKVGNYKPLDMGTEGVINMQIAGFELDDKADGSGKAPITWISKELLKTSRRMNPSLAGEAGNYTEGTGSIGGWEKCEMRKYFREALLPLVPENVRDRIVAVTKIRSAYDTAGTPFTQSTIDSVWPPSYSEMFIGLYKRLFPDNARRKKAKVGTTDYIAYHLCDANSRFGFHRISDAGAVVTSNTPAEKVYGIVLCFCT